MGADEGGDGIDSSGRESVSDFRLSLIGVLISFLFSLPQELEVQKEHCVPERCEVCAGPDQL